MSYLACTTVPLGANACKTKAVTWASDAERERNFSSGARRQREKEKGRRRQDFKILQILNRRVETGRECTSGGRGGVEGVQRCNKQVYVNSSKKNEKKGGGDDRLLSPSAATLLASLRPRARRSRPANENLNTAALTQHGIFSH